MILQEQEIKDLLQQTRRFKKLAETHEDERIADINQSIWSCIADILQVEDREQYYEVFAEYEVNHIDIEAAISKVKMLKNG